MGIGRALIVGVPQPTYGGFSFLKAVQSDYVEMVELFQKRYGWGDNVVGLWDKDGTFELVRSHLDRLATNTKSGDIAVFYYAGHGGDVSQDGDDAEPRDQTLCLYDQQMRDDFVAVALRKFPFGARVVVMTDSCHSGSVVRDLHPSGHSTAERKKSQRRRGRVPFLSVGLKGGALAGTTRDVQNIEDLRADVLHMAACQDPQESNEFSGDFGSHGYFTNGLLMGIDRGATSYRMLMRNFIIPETQRAKRSQQDAQAYTYGFHQQAFADQKPFDAGAAWPPSTS